MIMFIDLLQNKALINPTDVSSVEPVPYIKLPNKDGFVDGVEIIMKTGKKFLIALDFDFVTSAIQDEENT